MSPSILWAFLFCLVMNNNVTSTSLAFPSSRLSSFQNATITKASSIASGCPRPTDSVTSNLPYEKYDVGVIGLDQNIRSACSSSYNCWYQSSLMGQLNVTSALLGTTTITQFDIGTNSFSFCSFCISHMLKALLPGPITHPTSSTVTLTTQGFQASPPCCLSCYFVGDHVQFYYWPQQTAYNLSTAYSSQSTSVDTNGFTLWVYQFRLLWLES